MDIYNSMFDELIKKDTGYILKSTGSTLLDKRKIKLNFFNREIAVALDKRKIFYIKKESAGMNSIPDRYSSSLILHYLINADGAPLTGEWLPFRELPGGLFYWKTIPGILEAVVKKYGSNGNEFLKKAAEIGGQKYSKFRFASVIYPFKMFPILMILDEKDTEFDADVRVLFDSSAPHYLKTDVVKLIVAYIVNKLCR